MRLIDADILIMELEKDEEMFDKEAEDGKQNPQNCTAGYAEAMWSRANGIRDAIISIYDAPTIDAVEVVRCKDCKHRPIKEDVDGENYGFNLIEPNDGDECCPCLVSDGWYSWMPEDGFYCKYGERSK